MRLLRARPTVFVGPDVDVGTIPGIVSVIVELLACGTEVAVAFGKMSKTIGTVERTVFCGAHCSACAYRV